MKPIIINVKLIIINVGVPKLPSYGYSVYKDNVLEGLQQFFFAES